MNQKVIAFNKEQKRTDVPELQSGDVVRIHKRIKEGEKERVQVFKGMVIAVKGRQSSSPTITVRRESQGIGVEIVIPLYLPSIEKIELLRHSKVRRAKLYYMRERSGKAAKMKVKDLTQEEKAGDLKEEMPEEKVESADKKTEETKEKKEEVVSEAKEGKKEEKSGKPEEKKEKSEEKK